MLSWNDYITMQGYSYASTSAWVQEYKAMQAQNATQKSKVVQGV